jgi:hypothetical protein
MTFEIFPSTGAEGMCYEDDGTSFDYQKGNYRTVEVRASVQGTTTTIERSAARGEYLPPKRSLVFALNGVEQKPKTVSIRGVRLPEAVSSVEVKEGWSFDSSLKRLTVKIPDSQESMTVIVQ